MEVEDIYQEYDHFNEETNYWKNEAGPLSEVMDDIHRPLTAILLQTLHKMSSTRNREPEEVRQEINGRTGRIFTSYDTLHQILVRHEAAVQKRWMKKTRTQRLKILLEAWPDMAAVHRPDFHAFREEDIKRRKTRTHFRDHYVWPYINQEDLCKPKLLLLLLNSRGRNLPGEFAAGDIDAMHLGTKLEALKPGFLRGYVMIMDGSLGVEEYGKLVSCDLRSDWMDGDQKQISPGEGLLILEAQEKLLGFLVSCCQLILHDLTEDAMFSDRFPVVSEPRLKADTEVNGFDSLAIMAAEAPYRVPAKLDFDRLISLLSARASAAEDHMWALREDPGYFAEHVEDMKEHDPEIIRDPRGRTPFDKLSGAEDYWERSVRTVVFEAYKHYEMYSQLHEEVRELQSLQQKYESQISPDKDLPGEYQRAILAFQFHLREAVFAAAYQLQRTGASPPMRQFVVRARPSTSEEGLWITPKPGKKVDQVEGQLLLLLKTLWEYGTPIEAFRWTLVTDELERLLESEPRAKSLISPYIANCLGELSIITQCIRQFELYQPWARAFYQLMVQRQEEINKDFGERIRVWQKVTKVFNSEAMREAFRRGIPRGGKFAYPIEKRRSKENVESLRRAESNLDGFWHHFDGKMSQKAGNIESTAVHRLLSQPRAFQRTPEWVNEPSAKTSAPESMKSRHEDADRENVTELISAMIIDQFDHGENDVQTCIPPPQKRKVKTRKAASTSTTEVETTAEIPDPSGHANFQSRVEVDSRTFKVFRTLFFNPAATSTPAEISWTDFLRAMACMGFSIEKLYGSVWIFRPTTNELQQSIQFHEPHPRSKLLFTTARRFGRRLNRAYGWTGSMFILKEK
ncbi:hypothetical protein Daus18300_003836 [Diaporthe australafricana]|uniref:Clr5 domain-containing protein n=1 Tax=Diaporthe australafricana TaxID=127596 RepID=A0ABR3XDC6_9PEZI